MTQRIDTLQDSAPFISGPTEFMIATIVKQLLIVPQWKKVFGEFIDPYQRRDYPDRNMPCMRVYNEDGTKDSDDAWIEGDVKVDVIYPPLMRRKDLQQVQDTVVSALVQQFRRTDFFNAVSAGVPGLNQLGRVFTWDKSLGFDWKDEQIVPLTQITLNFKLDLRAWDDYLTSQNRTKEDPFNITLANLERLFVTTEAQDDQGNVKFTVGPDQDQGSAPT